LLTEYKGLVNLGISKLQGLNLPVPGVSVIQKDLHQALEKLTISALSKAPIRKALFEHLAKDKEVILAKLMEMNRYASTPYLIELVENEIKPSKDILAQMRQEYGSSRSTESAHDDFLRHLYQVLHRKFARQKIELQLLMATYQLFPSDDNADAAMMELPVSSKSDVVGGIDVSAITVKRKQLNAGFHFNEAAVRDCLQGGFNGFTPVVRNVTPVKILQMFM
jgi:hypothetical protein